MERKDHIDAFGVVALLLFTLNLAFNQVVVKVTGDGLQPIFAAGLRSFGAALVILIWLRLRGERLGLARETWPAGLLMGTLFGLEFMCLFTALDLTTVARVSVLFYTMPVWLALAAHFVLPGERLTGLRVLGLVIAMAGVVVAVFDRSGAPSLLGDVLALGAALCWAGIALCVRVTKLSDVAPTEQLIWQLCVSAMILLGASLLVSGPLVRAFTGLHAWAMAYQILAVASFGFLAWLWLMKRYPASGIASFSFLSPVFAVLLAWALLGEAAGLSIFVALGLVTLGVVLINRKA